MNQGIRLVNLRSSSQNGSSANQSTGKADDSFEITSLNHQPSNAPGFSLPANSYPAEENGVPEVYSRNRENQARGNEQHRWSVFARRHAQFLAICTSAPFVVSHPLLGLSIGSGLLYDSGPRLYYAGPVPLLIAYVFVGTILYSVMVPSFNCETDSLRLPSAK